jgi:hypothetical protein
VSGGQRSDGVATAASRLITGCHNGGSGIEAMRPTLIAVKRGATIAAAVAAFQVPRGLARRPRPARTASRNEIAMPPAATPLPPALPVTPDASAWHRREGNAR